jgi:hypothetical protein
VTSTSSTAAKPDPVTIDLLYEMALRVERGQIEWGRDLDQKVIAALSAGAVVLGLAATRTSLDVWAGVPFVIGAAMFGAVAWEGLHALRPTRFRVIHQTDDAYRNFLYLPDAPFEFKWAVAYEGAQAAPENLALLHEKADRVHWSLTYLGIETGFVAVSAIISVF